MSMLLLPFLLGTGGFALEPESPETRRWITFLRVERAAQTAAALNNARIYVPGFKRVFARHGVPEDLVWLALIESSFRYDPTSPTRAQGMFQFKKETARAFGLRVDRRVDERNEPQKAVRAAARYLVYLHEKFRDWDLVLAAYNLGEGDLRRTMQRHGAKSWEAVYPFVREETQNYVGKVKAAAVIGNAHLAETRSDASLKTYRVQKGDTLFGISKRHGLTPEQLRAANGLVGNTIYPGQILLIPGT